MQNITEQVQKSKPSLAEKANILKQYLLQHEFFRPYRSERNQVAQDKFEYDFQSNVGPGKPKCPLSVPVEFTDITRKVERSAHARIPPKDKYPKLFQEAEAGLIGDSSLVETYKARMKERPLLLCTHGSGESSVFYGLIKGSDYYNSIITDRINSASNALVKNYGFFYFLTFTYSYNDYGTNIVDAWKLFNKQLSATFKALRKKYKMGYVCVLEATKKGYPHAHVIFASSSAVENWHEKLTDGQKITHGQLFEFVKGHVASPVFALQKAGGQGLVKYLGKYVSKSAESAAKNPGVSKKGIDPRNRKALLSCLMPVLAQVRQYRFSIRDNIIGGVNWFEYSDEDYDFLKTLVDLGWCSPDGDLVLIRLLNKLTSKCKAHVWSMFDLGTKSAFEQFIGWYPTAPPDLLSTFKAVSMPMGCPGCIVSQFLNLLNRRDREDLHIPGEGKANFLARR